MTKIIMKFTLPLAFVLMAILCMPVWADQSLILVDSPASESDSPVVFDDDSLSTLRVTFARYANVTAAIQEVIQEGERIVLHVEAGADSPQVWNILQETIILDAVSREPVEAEALKAGSKVMAAYKLNMPMILIYPPQYTPEAVVILPPDDAGSVKIDTFDQDGLSSDSELKLNLSDETVIVDTQGRPLTKDELTDNTLVVFYSITTRSIPPQTHPDKIVVLGPYTAVLPIERPSLRPPTEPLLDLAAYDILVLTPDQIHEKDGVTYVRLTDVAAKLDYAAAWDGETKTVTLTKDLVSFVLKIGETEYGYNLALGSFTHAPIIVDGRAYVEDTFIEKLRLFSGNTSQEELNNE